MDAEQESLRNPLGLDEDCPNCPALAESRERVVHGYGDVGADLLVVGEAPTPGAETTGVPFTGEGAGVQSLLRDLGFSTSPPSADAPEIENAYLTYLASCRHPGRPPTEGEVGNCDPFVNAEVRMINPEIVVPVGERALRVLADTHTTLQTAPSIEEAHASELHGRGFLLVPMADPLGQTEADRRELRDTLAEILGGDYRQQKGRRGRRERAERAKDTDDSGTSN